MIFFSENTKPFDIDLMTGKNTNAPSPKDILQQIQKNRNTSKVKFICDYDLQEHELYVCNNFVETIHGDENLIIRMRLLSLLEIKYDIEK